MPAACNIGSHALFCIYTTIISIPLIWLNEWCSNSAFIIKTVLEYLTVLSAYNMCSPYKIQILATKTVTTIELYHGHDKQYISQDAPLMGRYKSL